MAPANYLTPVSLAYWGPWARTGTGGWCHGGTAGAPKLYTNAFSKDELNLLVEALDKNFSIKATINKSSIENLQTLYISKKQLPLVRDLGAPLKNVDPRVPYWARCGPKLNIDPK